MNAIVKWTYALLLTVAAITVSYLWLDRPIAYFIHDTLRHKVFEQITRIPEVIAPLALIALVVLGLHGLVKKSLSRLETVILLCAVSLAVTEVVKSQLKYAFGRTWPETWIGNNPSLIRDGVSSFHPFHGGAGYASFPSGHTAAICSVMSVLWICFPRYRVAYAICIAMVAVGLVGANYHFISDVIAGGFLGLSIGWLIVAIWEAGDHRVRPVEESASTIRKKNAKTTN
jgi:membrane-associated phospholipid phosphatase